MTPVDYALLAQRAYSDAPTVGQADSASRMCVYGDVHAFRGTDDVASFVHDFDLALATVPGLGNLHAGFWSAWQVIRDKCLSMPAPSAIAGHSLGAALAILCAAEWSLRGHVVPVYAFEPPRMFGDAAMQDLLAATRVPWFATRNGLDVVTQVPPGLTLPGPLTRIGRPSFSLDNLTDHGIGRVIEALASTGA